MFSIKCARPSTPAYWRRSLQERAGQVADHEPQYEPLRPVRWQHERQPQGSPQYGARINTRCFRTPWDFSTTEWTKSCFTARIATSWVTWGGWIELWSTAPAHTGYITLDPLHPNILFLFNPLVDVCSSQYVSGRRPLYTLYNSTVPVKLR